MNSQKQEKIKKFLSDELMSRAVFEVLQEVFLQKKKDADVNVLAASMLSLYSLEDGWKELQKLKDTSTSEREPLKQVGL